MSEISIRSLHKLFEAGLLVTSNTNFESLISYRFSLPENLISASQDLKENLEEILIEFHGLCSKYHLPTNNIVAFFHEIAIRYKEFYADSITRIKIKRLLQMVFADCDFLFGSSYISQNFSIDSLRAADLHVIAAKCLTDINSSNEYTSSLFSLAHDGHCLIDKVFQEQSSMNSGRRYYEDFSYFLDDFEKIMTQKSLFKAWEKHRDTMQEPFHLHSIQLEKFFEAYSQYCKMNGSESKQDDIETNLKQLRLASIAAFVFVRFLQYLSHAKGKSYPSYCRHLLQWIRYFFRTYEEYIAAFIAFDDEYISGVDNTIPEFQKIILSQTVDNEEYPHLLSGDFTFAFTISEELLLDSLKNHPLCRCIEEIHTQLQYVWVKKISAYYLFSIFNHAKDLKIPFKKHSYAASEMRLDLNTGIMSEDATAVRSQKASIYLFSALKPLCFAVLRTQDENLCDFLFDRCRGYTPHHEYQVFLPDISTFVESPKHQHEFLYQIDIRLQENLYLDPFGFTQYAQTQCTPADFYHFFYAPQTSVDKKIIKHLHKLLTSKTVEKYAEIALYPAESYGTSHQSIKWHEQMAKFFDSIMDSDELICNYVDGLYDDKEITMPGMEITFSDFQDAFIFADKSKPERSSYLPYAARIQMAIHTICLKKIAKEARKQALQILKEFFF